MICLACTQDLDFLFRFFFPCCYFIQHVILMKLIYQDFCVLLSPCLSSGCIAGNCILFYVEELNTVRYSVLMEEIQTSIEWLLTLHMYCIPAALSQLFIHHMLLHERKIDHLLVHYLQLVVGTIILSEGDVNPLFHETTTMYNRSRLMTSAWHGKSSLLEPSSTH